MVYFFDFCPSQYTNILFHQSTNYMTNEEPLIAGIQQIGIGNNDVYGTFKWYRQHFDFDVPIFDEAAEATLMLPYTGGQPQSRHAILALNMRGGGGLEIWQYTQRTPNAPAFTPELGDLGIFILKIKSSDADDTYRILKGKEANILSDVTTDPAGQKHFFLTDLHGNLLEVVETKSTWFSNKGRSPGGAHGCTIGVSDVGKSIEFYKNILGYDEVVYDKTAAFDDLQSLPGGAANCRRVLLRHSQPRQGAFSNLLGSSEIELVQVEGRPSRKIFDNRFWGDLGYIHLCFDITNMGAMRKKCKSNGHPFTVDSGDFDMGEAAGQFAYIEDPDGVLIEFVETHKIPIMKKFGWYLDLRKRPKGKKLPNWMVKALGFGRVKD